MNIKRLKTMSTFSDIVGLVLTSDEKEKITEAEVRALFEKIGTPEKAIRYCMDRIFGNVGWGEQYFYD